MFYLSGNKRGNLLGVVDTDDMIEEFYTPEFLNNLGIEIIRFNKELEIGYSFKTKCFKFTLVDESNIKGWKLEALDGIDTFRNKASYLGYPVISLYLCFEGYKGKKLNVRDMDTSNVINMRGMFICCENLTTLDLSNFNTSKVTNTRMMFKHCGSLTTLDLSSFSTSKVIDMHQMFYFCVMLTTLDLSNFDTSNVTDMTSMFSGCRSLTTLDLSSFNTSKVTNMSHMFHYCKSLTTLDLSNFDTSKVETIYEMFFECGMLTTLDLSSFDTSNVTNMIAMFYECNNLVMLHTSDKEIFNHCNARITLVPKSLGVEYDKLIRNKKDVAKFLLLDFKGTIAYED